ncbi:MAG: hypothetical protein ABI210_02190 [Abditibacteriaceae bacterium]
MKRQLKISFMLTFTIAIGAFLLSRATPGRSQQTGITADQVKTTLQGMGMTVQESSPDKDEKLLTVMWDHDHFHYETFVSVSQGKWVWFLSPLQGIPDPSQIPQNILLELLHQNDQNGGWYFSWDPDQKRFYLNHLFYYAEFTPENVQSNVDLYEKVLAKSLRYWDPKQWNNPAAPVPSITPQ